MKYSIIATMLIGAISGQISVTVEPYVIYDGATIVASDDYVIVDGNVIFRR